MMLRHCFFIAMLCLWGSYGLLEKLEKPEVREVKMRLEEEKAKRLLLQNDVEMLMLKTEKLERALAAIDTTKPGKLSTREEVSFSVRLSQSVTLDQFHVLKFDDVLHNEGSGYSPNTGIFRAPVAGTYVFALSLLSKGKGLYYHVNIVKNGTEIGRLFAGDSTSGWPDQGSVTVVTSLVANEEIFTREFSTSGSLHNDFYCTFSGFLL